MEENKHHVYFLNLRDIKYEYTKIGKTSGILDRMSCYNTSSPLTHCQIYLIIECNKKKHSDKLERFLHKTFDSLSTTNHENYEDGAGREWFQKDKFTVEEIKKVLDKFKYKNECRIIHGEELDKLMDELKRKEREPTQYSSDSDSNSDIDDFEESIWKERDYQRTIIDYITEKLINFHKLYLELATGGGKSYIIYNILSIINPEVIVIFSPRKKINEQNCDHKYLSILKNEYLIYNCSNDKNFDIFYNKCIKEKKKIIIVACPQASNKKVYDIIQNNKLSDIFIWFDEAHHTIENWIDRKDDKHIKFMLEENKKVKDRIFTSASPNKKRVQEYPQIFGELYNPIKVKELIDKGWLCPIKCKILEYDIKNINLLNWILNGFNDNNKSYGFSFHNRDNNAFNLFYKHYEKYLNSETQIKPYLLIHDAGLNKLNKDKLKYIRLSYDFRNVSDFENKITIEENPKNMAYVVKKFDMGYDFSELDYIVITDSKIASNDIIQCIGRGTRPDKKDHNGTNLEKELLLMLPTYINEEETNEYKNIIEVLRYLILDLEMDIEEVLVKNIDSTESKETTGLDYSGAKENTSKLLDLLYSNNILNRVNTKTLNKFCKKYCIKTEQDYYRFKELNSSLNLKSNLYEYPGFYWKNVVDPNNELYYSSKQQCIKAKEKIINESENLEEEAYEELMIDIEDDGWIELNKHDSKIPPYRDLDKFYPQL